MDPESLKIRRVVPPWKALIRKFRDGEVEPFYYEFRRTVFANKTVRSNELLWHERYRGSDSGDIAQDLFIKLANERQFDMWLDDYLYPADHRIAAMLNRSIKNFVLTIQKGGNRYASEPFDKIVEPTNAIGEPYRGVASSLAYLGPAEAFELKERATTLLERKAAMISKMSEKEQFIYRNSRAWDWGSMKNREIADALNLSEAMIEKYIRKIRTLIRTMTDE